MIESEGEDEMAGKAVCRLISKNTTLKTQYATEEELLQETVDELKDAFEVDLSKVNDGNRDENFEYKYPNFIKKTAAKALEVKNAYRYRRIFCVPSFALGLVMASRIRSHYTHAPWFKLTALGDMIDVYGSVSERAEMRRTTHDRLT